MSDLHCTWRQMLREAAERFRAAGIDGAQRDARLLLADALGVDTAGLILREEDAIDGAGLAEFEARVSRRLAGEPVSRIRGWREFYGRRFIVTPDVLDPRPETELLVEHGVRLLPHGARVIDLGTGSGCILISVLAERADAEGLGVDISPAALEVARRNAAMNDVAEQADFVLSDWNADAGLFDLVLSNPPYVAEADFAGLDVDVRAYDPKIALTAGDGLTAYRAILGRIDSLLKPGGWLGFEHGASQSEAVLGLMNDAGLVDVDPFQDLAGHARAAFGRRPG